MLLVLALPALAQASPLEEANLVRARAGLPALSRAEPDPTAALVMERLLEDGTPGPDEGDELCGCFFYQEDDDSYLSASALYRQLGGQRIVGFWSYGQASGLERDRSTWALLLDPRVQQLAWQEDGQTVVLAAFASSDRPLGHLQLSHPSGFDPQGTTPLLALLPARTSTVSIQRRQGGRWNTELRFRASAADGYVNGMNGAVMYNLAAAASTVVERTHTLNSGVVFAFGRRYRVSGQPLSITPMPRQDIARRFRYGASMPGRYRRALRRHLARTPAWARRQLALVDGWTTVKSHSAGGVSITGWTGRGGQRPYYFDFLRSHLMDRRFGSFIAAHELGHLFDLSGLTLGGERELWRQFARSPRYRRCFPGQYGPNSCIPKEEVLADQFAFVMTGQWTTRSGYGIPPLISRRAFLRVLRRWWAPLPASYGFPLDERALVDGDEELLGTAPAGGKIA